MGFLQNIDVHPGRAFFFQMLFYCKSILSGNFFEPFFISCIHVILRYSNDCVSIMSQDARHSLQCFCSFLLWFCHLECKRADCKVRAFIFECRWKGGHCTFIQIICGINLSSLLDHIWIYINSSCWLLQEVTEHSWSAAYVYLIFQTSAFLFLHLSYYRNIDVRCIFGHAEYRIKFSDEFRHLWASSHPSLCAFSSNSPPTPEIVENSLVWRSYRSDNLWNFFCLIIGH